MYKRKISAEDKIYAVNLYLNGKESQHRIASMFDVSVASLQQWIRNYESLGANAFIVKKYKKYSKDLKQQAVLDYLAGRGSQDDICKKYGIRSKAKLQIWIKKYNGYEELKQLYENPPQNVHFIGIIPRESMNDIYNMADMLFMPSYNELFPMSILEAINSQKPLLLRDLELYEDILFHKYLVADNNKDFAQIIQNLKNDSSLYHQYQQASYEISQYYSKEHVKEMWKDFYLHIAQKKLL